MKNDDMFQDIFEIDGVTVEVDPINRVRTDDEDNVMCMFADEQPPTWHIAKPFIAEALEASNGSIDFIDVGTGSGIFGVLFAKHFGGEVVAIDKSKRAIDFAQRNAEKNGINFTLKHKWYEVDSAPEQSAKVIGLYPPYHIYPESIKEMIPQHARGGWDGQEVFKSQLEVAREHLAPNGTIFVNQMCWGDESGPDFLRYIPEMMPGASVLWTNVPGDRIKTEEFLAGVYGEKHPDFIREVSDAHPWLYYTVMIIRNDGLGQMEEFTHDFPLPSPEEVWQHRIALHHQIALHEYHDTES